MLLAIGRTEIGVDCACVRSGMPLLIQVGTEPPEDVTRARGVNIQIIGRLEIFHQAVAVLILRRIGD